MYLESVCVVFQVRCVVAISGIHEQPLDGTIADILAHYHK